MGFQEDELPSVGQPADAIQEQPKKAKFTYAREFLLSLGNLELCKQLPIGFDKSILSEFHDAFHGSQDKAKVSGGLPTQNFRRTEYSASPPTRRDASNYSRGSAGKWESRSRDSDSQSDRDSETGRQIGTHSRRPWQNSEHDGLLGSGSSPKLTGYTSGTSVPKLRVNDQNHLTRSNAPYQPPRPYKAVPHIRSTTSDLRNDETFGSSEMTSEDQAEEERKRRAEFELMRKGRHKSGENKQYSDSKSDAAEYQRNLKDEKKIMSEANESHVPPTVVAPHSVSTKSSSSLQTPAARPVIPPGFVPPGFGNPNAVAKFAFKHDTKVETSEINSDMAPGTRNSSVERTSGNKTVKQPDDHSHLNINNHARGFDLLANGKGLDSTSSKGPMLHAAAVSNQNFAPPLLEDIFGNSFTANGGGLSISAEQHIDGNQHDKWKGSTMESSKFAHWFVEDDDKRLEDGGLSEKPLDLFSLMGGGPTSKVDLVDSKASKSSDTTVPVLTCEDLEQSILSEMSYHKMPSETLRQGSESLDVNAAQPKVAIDALASQHLLSVLQKGPGPNDMCSFFNISKGSTSMDIATHGLEQQNADKATDLGKNPTLEAIFGSAFMKELQTADAPVSTKRDSIGDSSRFRLPEDEILISSSDHLNPSNSFDDRVDGVNNPGYAPSTRPLGNPDRLGALSAMFRDGRSARLSQGNHVLPRNSYDTKGPSMYQNIRAHSSAPQLLPQHTGQGLPMFNRPNGHHPSPHVRFPDNMIRHDSPAAHQFSPSHQVFNQPRPVGFEPPSKHPMMQQAHLQGNAAPSHLLGQYSGNLPQPPYPYSQMRGFRQELDSFQGFHTGHQQPGFSGTGLLTPVSDIGASNHHPEVLQRLMEMELRSNPKPSHPFAGHLGRLPNL